ncbi:hypothetical protein SAMN05444340_113101 [Citreimonas salinaria]|uniref:Uncharacterized protein n=1 Tax=Citreimonas salinaria TaxID=321339 RepID=A0A1H3LMA1_9RHOB|nr:hypothetical protein SAMN05444340_113101 [Citreimonas salinaria]
MDRYAPLRGTNSATSSPSLWNGMAGIHSVLTGSVLVCQLLHHHFKVLLARQSDISHVSVNGILPRNYSVANSAFCDSYSSADVKFRSCPMGFRLRGLSNKYSVYSCAIWTIAIRSLDRLKHALPESMTLRPTRLPIVESQRGRWPPKRRSRISRSIKNLRISFSFYSQPTNKHGEWSKLVNNEVNVLPLLSLISSTNPACIFPAISDSFSPTACSPRPVSAS